MRFAWVSASARRLAARRSVVPTSSSCILRLRSLSPTASSCTHKPTF